MDWLQKNCHYESEWTESAKASQHPHPPGGPFGFQYSKFSGLLNPPSPSVLLKEAIFFANLPKGGLQKLLSGFFSLRGYPPPLTENCRKFNGKNPLSSF